LDDQASIIFETNDLEHFLDVIETSTIKLLQDQKPKTNSQKMVGPSPWEIEGVNPSSEIITLRKKTCKQIWKDLKYLRLFLIKAPPFTGKSSLATLFKFYLDEKGSEFIKTFFIYMNK